MTDNTTNEATAHTGGTLAVIVQKQYDSKKMNIKLFNDFLKLKILEKILSITSLFFGLILTLNSAYYIWAYNFTGILFLFMLPVTILVSELIIGLFLTFSGYCLITSRRISVLLYKMTGILMILYPINQFILDKLDSLPFDNYLIPYLFLPFGLFLYALMHSKKYKEFDKKHKRLKSEIIKIVIGLEIFILIDVIFYS